MTVAPWIRRSPRLRDVPAHAPAPRPDLLLGHAPPAGRRPAGDARALRLRAHGRRDRRRPAPRRRRRRARRAALDAWEGELERGLAAGRSPHPVVGALVDAGAPPPAAARRAADLHALDADRLRAGPDRDAGTSSSAYMDGSAGSVGRIMAPLLGVPERHHAGFGRLGHAFQLTNFIRDVREDTALDRVYLPAEDRERFGVGEADLRRRSASPELRALLALEVRRARAMFAEAEPALAAAPGSVRSGHAARGRRLPARARPRRADRLRRARPPRPASAPWQLPGAVARGAAPVTRRATLRGADAHSAGRARRRADLRRQLRGARGRARAGGQRRRRARRRPLRDRRAPDVRLRGARRRGSRRWACGTRSARSSPCMAFHTPHGSARYAAAVELVGVRLPDAVRGAVGAVRRALRDREGRARVGDTVVRPTAGPSRRR